MRSATWQGRQLQEESRKAPSTRASVLKLRPALESNAFLSNSEMGAGLTQPCGCGFLSDDIRDGLLGRRLSY